MNKLIKWLIKYLPDKFYLKLKYKYITHKSLNLENPKTFMEKIQWLKIHDRKPEYRNLVDKLAVKEIIRAKIGDEYVIPTIKIWDSIDDISLDQLPNSFVLKTNKGGGNNGVCICSDKTFFELDHAKIKLHNSSKFDIYKEFREWPYKDIKVRYFAEQLLNPLDNNYLTDYKFFCFNGVPKYIQVITDRTNNEKIQFYDTNWQLQEFVGLNPSVEYSAVPISKPKNLELMIRIASILSKGTYFLRVDLYNINGQIYFGELTFYPASGMGKFKPEEWNNKLGNLINLPL